MNKVKPILAMPFLGLLCITLSCSKGIAPPMADSTTAIQTAKTEGWVHDKHTLEPLKNVLVMSLPSRSKGVTNAEGKCWFDRHATDTVVVFRRRGYKKIHVPINPDNEIVGAMFDDTLKK